MLKKIRGMWICCLGGKVAIRVGCWFIEMILKMTEAVKWSFLWIIAFIQVP